MITTPRRRLTALVAATVALAACGSDTPPSKSSGATQQATVTPEGSKPVPKITWALYRDVAGLDPVFAFDYPENTVLSLLCEAPLRQNPDGTIVSGITDVTTPDATTMMLKIKPGVTFWNGDPVTAADVAFSLNRNRNKEIPGFYGQVYARVADIQASTADTVTITLSEPDQWLKGELASTSAWVVQQKFVEAAGGDFGNPTGRTMCSGAYKLGDWQTGSPLSAVRNDSYWNTAVKPKVAEISFIAAPDPTALTAGLQSGDVNGYFAFAGMPTLTQLKADKRVTVTSGAGYQMDALVLSGGPDSTLGTVKARQALSLAIDRTSYIAQVIPGGAVLPKSFAPPGLWSYASAAFKAAYAALADVTQDLDKAKALAKEAGIEGKSITIGLFAEASNLVAEVAAIQKAAEAIGLKVTLKTVPADQYINFFIDPEFRKGVDGFVTVSYPDFADPGALFAIFALPDGSQNYSGYSNPQVTQLLNEARSTADDNTRAAKVIEAQKLLMNDLPYIPMSLPYNTTITSSNLSGEVPSFAMMFAPWADKLGGV